MGHRRWLPQGHHFCRQCKSSNGEPEDKVAPPSLRSEKVWELMKDLDVDYGKQASNTMDSDLKWKKKSIPFELAYWS